MEAGGAERRGGELCLQVGDAGLGDLILLLLTARPAPGDGAARGEPLEPGGLRGPLARSLQRAEAMLRSCVTPGLRRLLPPRPRRRGDGDSDEEDEDEDEAASVVTPLEQSFAGLRRCLRVWEDPRTETFQGHVRPRPGGAGDFSEDAVRQRVAARGAALHALLRHRHLLRLARDFARRLKASSDFLRRLLALPVPAGRGGRAGPALRELCLELRAHAGHWAALRRRLRGDAWLRALPRLRREAVAHMRRALLLPALMAARLARRHAEGCLRALGRPGTPALAPESLAELFQGLEIYNRVVQGLAEELGPEVGPGGLPAPFTVDGVLRVLAAERGRAVAERLQPLLRPQGGDIRDGRVCWEDVAVPWPPGPDAAGTDTATDAEGSGAEALPGLAAELRALCLEDEELTGHVLGALVASADSLWQPVLSESPEPVGPRPGSGGGWKSVRWLDAARGPAAAVLGARYRPMLWGAAGAALGHGLGTPTSTLSATVTAAQELSRALVVARVPPECQEELGVLCLRLICRSILCSWDTDFTCALGSGLSDKCLEVPGRSPGPGCSRTAQQLRRLFPALVLALRCLRPLPTHPHACPGGPCLRLQVLGRCLAAAAAAHAWLTGRAGRYLAAWALPQFLLLTQGDLQVLKAETEQLVLQVSATFPEPGDTAGDTPPEPPPGSPWELQLCRQIHGAAHNIQVRGALGGGPEQRGALGACVTPCPLPRSSSSPAMCSGCSPPAASGSRPRSLTRRCRWAGTGGSGHVPSCPAPPARTRRPRCRRCWGRCCRGHRPCPTTPRHPLWHGSPQPSWRPGWTTSSPTGSSSACRGPCSCGRTSRRCGSCCARSAPGWPPRPSRRCGRCACSATRTRPCAASCSSRGGAEGTPAAGPGCGAAAQMKAPTPWIHPRTRCLFWTPWRWRSRCRGLPCRARVPTCRAVPSRRSRAAPSSGCPCGCTAPAAGECRGCPAWATAPRADPQ